MAMKTFSLSFNYAIKIKLTFMILIDQQFVLIVTSVWVLVTFKNRVEAIVFTDNFIAIKQLDDARWKIGHFRCDEAEASLI